MRVIALVVLLCALRARDRTDVGAPLDTQGQRAAWEGSRDTSHQKQITSLT
jgi:hypothetical protein